ncbi:nucleotidyl transferase AbiEii/AbiGii toxin family protein [Thermosipho atlanticus]|uniref:Nucleotidyl transferase AbiEii toxin, Type IV TA system n=1 Tax=Thermosipho atlanticus DSM 15807 TaxID=1123380 RepID=A0A1M5RNK0_9BACT|nr:nucleotidyl transferase AbiEii/AbiGii toxin family protein [Thermosipho atlanticus]SHH27855.1 Nucleotidyl transferase AbiEii toxin, Type IV TA system [Thermosipho atlanticus DSM 15807]
MSRLTSKQKEVLEKILELDIFHEFYLAGGTSLLLKYNHRLSLDFDFFLLPNKKFKLELYEKKMLTSFQNLEIVYRDTQTLIFDLNGVKISLFEYPYPLIKEIERIKNVPVASDEDIACMKVDAISKRGLKKDFFDLWILIRIHKWSINDLFEMIQKKYSGYNLAVFLKSLTYFDDAEKNKDFQEVENSWNIIKDFFRNYVKTYKF